MRVVLDTNILVSALMIQIGNPAAIYLRLAGGTLHAPDLRGASRRAASHAAKAKNRRAHQAL
jgi:hypothetical protein